MSEVPLYVSRDHEYAQMMVLSDSVGARDSPRCEVVSLQGKTLQPDQLGHTI